MKRSSAIAIAFLHYICPAYASGFRTVTPKNFLSFIIISSVHIFHPKAFSQQMISEKASATTFTLVPVVALKKLVINPGGLRDSSLGPHL